MTEFVHFAVSTRPCEAPEGRDWGGNHWRFLVRAKESGATHKGYFSAGESVRWSSDAEFHADVLESLGVDSFAALEGGGNMVSYLEALEAEGAGYGLVEGYRVAVELARFYEFVSALTEAELAALGVVLLTTLTGDCEEDE